MRFLYTGAKEKLLEQNNPDDSLGGFVSKSVIPNRKNNLFADISYLSTFNESEECRAVVIENNSSNELKDIQIGYSYDEELYEIEVAIVELNDEGRMERINNPRDLPYYAEFINGSIEDEDETFPIILDFAPNKMYGMWVKRKIKPQLNNDCVEAEETVIKNFEFIIKYEE